MDKVVIETFKSFGTYELDNMRRDMSCFNGFVSVVKHKVTIEEIPCSQQEMKDRIQLLWDKCDNYHHHGPLKSAAKKHGIVLEGSPGKI